MNRLMRRMQRFGRSFQAGRSQSRMEGGQAGVYAANTPQDVTSTRAKNTGHKKVTADKWNQ